MGYQGVTDYADSKGWMGGMRNKDLDSGIALPPTIEARYGYQSSTYEWGATVDGSTVQADFQITNCLDTRLNTWDDGWSTHANWSNWSTDSTGQKQIAYTTSAQNCHRRIDWNGDGDTVDTGEEPGWNTATPW
jgi:hypothetical protein